MIFLLCFTSFAVVLALGGGPDAATLEVAIFEALRFEGQLYGFPLAFKSPVLIYNRALVSEPPADTDALFAQLEALTDIEPILDSIFTDLQFNF